MRLGIEQLVVLPLEVGINTTKYLGNRALSYMSAAIQTVGSPSLGIYREANHFPDEVQTIGEDIKNSKDPRVKEYDIQWLAAALYREFRKTNQRGESISTDYIAQMTSVMKEAGIPFNIAEEAFKVLPDLAEFVESLTESATPSE